MDPAVLRGRDPAVLRGRDTAMLRGRDPAHPGPEGTAAPRAARPAAGSAPRRGRGGAPGRCHRRRPAPFPVSWRPERGGGRRRGRCRSLGGGGAAGAAGGRCEAGTAPCRGACGARRRCWRRWAGCGRCRRRWAAAPRPPSTGCAAAGTRGPPPAPSRSSCRPRRGLAPRVAPAPARPPPTAPSTASARSAPRSSSSAGTATSVTAPRHPPPRLVLQPGHPRDPPPLLPNPPSPSRGAPADTPYPRRAPPPHPPKTVSLGANRCLQTTPPPSREGDPQPLWECGFPRPQTDPRRQG